MALNYSGLHWLAWHYSIALGACFHQLPCFPNQVIIVDESHTLRTTDRPPDSRITEAAVAAVRAAARAVLLSGTPSLSRPYDLFRQVASLVSGKLDKDSHLWRI